jgi:hypothetical protein
MTDSTEALVTERGKTHGRFEDHAYATQDLKCTLKEHLHLRAQRNQPSLNNMQLESLEMILHKIGRIVAGDANFQDHWDDIAGYAKIANGSY